MALPEEKVSPEDLWMSRVLEACEHGDTGTLETLLSAADEKSESKHAIPVAKILQTAVRSNQVDVVQMLIEKYPDFPTSEERGEFISDDQFHGVQYQLRFIKPGLPMYKVMVARWPEIKKYDYGEGGDRLGGAAYAADLEFVEYLIADGEDASRASILTRPILPFIKPSREDIWMDIKVWLGLTPKTPVTEAIQRQRKIYQLLRAHGAPDKGHFS